MLELCCGSDVEYKQKAFFSFKVDKKFAKKGKPTRMIGKFIGDDLKTIQLNCRKGVFFGRTDLYLCAQEK